MAALAFGALGAWLAPVGYASLGWSIGSTLGGMMSRSSSNVQMPTQFGPRMGDGYVLQSNYGNAIPIMHGWGRISGNVVWAGTIIETEHTSSQTVGGGGKGGGGGGSSTTFTTTTYTYTVSCAVAVCKGPIAGIVRIWGDDTLLYDADDPGNAEITTVLRIQLGDEAQVPDAAEEAELGVGNVPGYRGIARVIFDTLELSSFGNRLPNFWFEVNGIGTEI